jgi:hypothetical protein
MISRFCYISSLFACLLMVACSRNVPKQNSVKNDAFDDKEMLDFVPFNLIQYGIPAVMMLPDETSNIGAVTKPEVIHLDNDFKWKIKVGQQFQILIEDYGDYSNLVDIKRKELRDQTIFKIRYLQNEKDIIVFEKTLLVKGAKKAPLKLGLTHRSYHVYGQKKIGNITYELKCDDNGEEEFVIKLMAKTINSFQGFDNISYNSN